MTTELMAEVGTNIDRWLRDNPEATADEAARELIRRYLQKQIHSSGKEMPYQSGQLARLVGIPITYCPWLQGSWQHGAFEAGYNNPPDPVSR